jgi:hypothetical protein
MRIYLHSQVSKDNNLAEKDIHKNKKLYIAVEFFLKFEFAILIQATFHYCNFPFHL